MHHPDDVAALAELGLSQYDAGRLQSAIASYQAYLKVRPGDSLFHSNLGVALVEAGRIDDAIASFTKAIELAPDNPEHHYNASMAYLYKPDQYALGLEKYAWRSRKSQQPILPDVVPDCPEWQGGSLGPGESILVVSEQGFGDVFQFVRYIDPLRQQRQIPVSVCAPEKLHGLLKASGIDASPLALQQGRQFRAGQWISMMSLPGRLGVTPADPIRQQPYLCAPPDRVATWRARLADAPRPLIALNWQGNPQHEFTVARGRSLPLEALAPLAAIGGISLLSLQKGVGSEQLQTCSFRHRFVAAQPEVDAAWDFLDAAAIIASCDLVITSDTAVAHLAGGMGRPTWLLLKQVPEWRWGLEGETTFWYPSMRLFRQRQPGDWDELMERLVGALQQWLSAQGFPGQPAAAHR
ncbi:MAG: tetratricopeptide repeat protein [Cyanobium sp.]